jgi:subtilisin family serine protease
MLKTYNVALNEGVDYDAFWNEIETNGSGSTYVPTRSVDIINARPSSLRQCWYELSDEEAEKLRNDPRVYCVEIPPEHRTDIELKHSAVQTGLYYKSPGTNPANNLGINWGLFRLNSTTNNTPGSSGTLDYNYSLDGTGVDFVVSDSGCQIDHPEFTDAYGVTRVQQINWYTASGVSGTMPSFAAFYSDYDGHGTHCTGIAAGKTYGRAKNARIYVMSVDGLTVAPTVGIPISDCFDTIKGWHNNKPIDPVTGFKRPTVVNMSWGYNTSFTNINGGVYRGTPWSGTTRQTNYGMIGAPSGYGYNIYATRVDSVDVDVAELLAAGVVLVGAAGNSYQTVDVPGGSDYDNYWNSTSFGTRYYMRGGSPCSAPGVICVGNVSTIADTPEEKAGSSESGPRVDLYAPGTNIVSTTSNTNVDGAITPYPFNASYKIMSISGTSMASPNVAGIAAQLLQLYPYYTPAQIRALIIAESTTSMLYTTGSATDYSNSRSLHGGPNRFAYMPYNTSYNLVASGAIEMTNVTINTE